jgi:hypothetical protein
MDFQMPLLNHLTMFSPFSVILLCMVLMWIMRWFFFSVILFCMVFSSVTIFYMGLMWILEQFFKSVTLVCMFCMYAKEIIWKDGIKCNYFEVMPNKDCNEILFSNNVPIGTQEASNNNMEASWVILSSQFLAKCDIWYP